MSDTLPFISQRLWFQHLRPQLLVQHLEMIASHPGACDEVWFATDYGFPKIAVHEDHARQMADAAATVRAAGLRASFQISNTIGHGDYLKFLDFDGLSNPMVGDDGTVAPYCWCPRAAAFHAYIDSLTRAYCAWQPDSLWIDDDLRLRNHAPAQFGCYCDVCMAEFSEFTGAQWMRETLALAINEGDDFATRASWLEFGSRTLAAAATSIGRAAIETAPKCRLGLQHCDSEYAFASPNWTPVFDALYAASNTAVGSRPGGGFYHDHQPRDMVEKAISIGLQTSSLPNTIAPVTYECENLPDTRFGKSAHGTALECTLAIAYGCDSLSFTPLMFPQETTWHENMLAQLEAWRPFWLRYAAASTGTRNSGIDVAFGRETRIMPTGYNRFTWWSPDFGGISPLAAIGLPVCFNRDAPATWLRGSAAKGVTANELETLVGRGLLIDGEAAAELARSGLDHIIGLRYRQETARLDNLLFTDDEINNNADGNEMMLCGFMFARPIEPGILHAVGEDKRLRPLSWWTTPDGRPQSIEAAAIELPNGGRVVLFGGGIGNSTIPTRRRQQIAAAADWVSRERLPVLLETSCPAVIVPRCGADNVLKTVMILNISLDPTPPLELTVRSNACEWTWACPNQPDRPIHSQNHISLPPLAPWGVGALITNAPS